MHFDHPLITQRYFFPRGARPPEGEVEVEVDGATLCCARHRARGAGEEALTLLHFHGNGEVVADYIPGFAAEFEALGVHSFFAEYRGYGGSSGTPKMATMLEDVEALLEATGAPPEQVVAFGRSLGSIYAIELAHRCPGLGGLVLESGIADPLERILLRIEPKEMGITVAELQAEARQLFEHRLKLRAYTRPMLVMHTREDHLVHCSHAERNHTWGGGRYKKLVILDRGDHNSAFSANREVYLRELDEFFDLVRDDR